MNLDEYLMSLAEQVHVTGRDSGLENQKDQLRSKRLLASLAPAAIGGIGFRYDTERLVRNASFILQSVITLVENGRQPDEFSRELLTSAQVFEHLASLKEGTDPTTSMLLAAGLYELAGYQANALCLARAATVPLIDRSSHPLPTDLLLRWTALALRGQFVGLLREATEVADLGRSITGTLRATLDSDESHVDGMLSSSQSVLTTQAFASIAGFALRGEPGNPDTSPALIDLLNVLKGTAQASSFLVAKVLQAVVGSLAQHSTWRLLEGQIAADGTWRRYAALLARGRATNALQARGSLELWKSQRSALEGGLLEGDPAGFVIRMPTSAGKTRIAELAILRHLTKSGARSRAIYVAPYRALADEVENSLQDTFSDLGFQVSSVLGSYEVDEFDDFLLQLTDILVATPEKLSLLMRTRPEYFDDVGIVVLDEGHIIDDATRGARYECLLTNLRSKLGAQAQMLFISAVVQEENARDFAEWLCRSRNSLISTDWRPTRQSLGILRWSSTNATGRIDFPREAVAVGTSAPFVPQVIRQRTYRDFTPKLRKETTTQFPLPTKGDVAAELALAYAPMGPVLVFTTRPDWAESTAKAIQKALRLRSQTDPDMIPGVFREALADAGDTASVEASDAWLGKDSRVSSLLRQGIAVHHGGLPDAVRRAIEKDFKAGHFPVIVANNTLAQGVNLPIKTVIVHTVTRHEEGPTPDDPGENVTVSTRDFWNICGRAGRAGAETEGQIIFLSLNRRDEMIFSEYATQEYEPIEGRLFELLRALTAARLTHEDFAADLDSEILALLAEEVAGGDEFGDLIRTSFVSIQARRSNLSIEPLMEAGRAVTRGLLERVPDAERRKVFARTGLRATSCEQLAEAISADSASWATLLSDPNSSTADVAGRIFGAVCVLPEMQPRYSYEADHLAMLLDWVTQVPIDELKSSYADSEIDEPKLIRFIEDFYAFRLPWGFSGFLQIAAHILGIEVPPESKRWLPSMIKYGVASPRACWAMALGAPTRDIAARISEAFISDSADASFANFVQWFSELTEEDFAYRLGASPHQVATLNRRAQAIVGGQREREANPFELPLVCQLHGHAYEGRGQAAEAIRAGDEVGMIREFTNHYDFNAIQVAFAGNVIGYIDRPSARRLAPMLDSGTSLRAHVLDVRREHGLAVTIQVAEDLRETAR